MRARVCLLSINLREKTLFNLFEFMTWITGLTSKAITKVFKPDPVVDPPQRVMGFARVNPNFFYKSKRYYFG